MRILSRALVFIISLSLIPSFAKAALPLDVVINEIAWMGSKIEGIEPKNWWRYEWLELFNNTENQILFDGWKIELDRTKTDWILDLKGTILPKSYFLIVSSDKISPDFDLNYSNLGGKFINSGQKVLLKDINNQVIDEIDCTSGWFAGDNSIKQTLERINPQLVGSVPANWETSQNPGGTPRAENSVSVTTELPPPSLEEPPTQFEPQPDLEPELPPQEELQPQSQPIAYSSSIVINEIIPSPEGPDDLEEWIELKNLNDEEVDLSKWKIQDTTGSITAYSFPEGTKIAPRDFLVLSRPTTKITLNNSGDTLKLIQPDGKIIDEVSYENAPQGQSYNRNDSGWAWSSNLTPGNLNKTVVSIAKIKEEAKPSKETAEELVPEKETINLQPEQGLAAIGEQKTFKNLPSSSFVPLIALLIAVFSGLIILILKTKLQQKKNLLN